jgi:hypothetical protein
MNLDQKPWIFLWRPFYRSVVVPIVWPLLHRLKEFFFRETIEELRRVTRRQTELSHRMIPLENQLNRLLPEIRQEFVEGATNLTGEHQRQAATLEALLRDKFGEGRTAIESQMNVLSQMIRQEFVDVVAKLTIEHQQQWATHQQQWATVTDQITALRNQMNALPSQVRQEFLEGLAKLAGEQQQQWTALEELLLNMLNQPIANYSPERDDSRGAVTSR